MDHKWGRNITTYGLGDLGATVCSRFLGSGLVVFTNSWRADIGRFLAAVKTPDGEAWVFTYGYEPVPGHPHFPYGWPVEPDAPA